MSHKMLYRFTGEPESGVFQTDLGFGPVEAKKFPRGERVDGWVSPARLREFWENEGREQVQEAAEK